MRHVTSFLTAVAVSAGVVAALPGIAGAQTGDLAAFCAARQEANSAETKAENKAVIDKVYAAAPAAAIPAITEIRDGFAKKGQRYFETAAGADALAELDTVVYDSCPGTAVAATATDYEFAGIPATLPAGGAKFKLTNAAPVENHELVVLKLNDKGAGMDPEDVVALPQKKAEKLIDYSASTFMFAPPGQSGYGLATLTPGEYVYACFVGEAGKKNAKPHAALGMHGGFTVS
jgi:hypothetical protein